MRYGIVLGLQSRTTQLGRALGPTQKALDAGLTVQLSCSVHGNFHGSLVTLVTARPASLLYVAGTSSGMVA